MNTIDHEHVRSDLHRAAREYASRGWPIFPVVAGTKTPATAHGFKDASLDLAQVDRWWTENPSYNIAFSPSDVGLSVVDPDGAEGIENWMALQDTHGEIPSTYAVATPRGGLHLYYEGELPPTQSILAQHVDTRGRGSYALLPPSRLDGWPEAYHALNDLTPIPLPEWVRTAASYKREKAKASVADLDLPVNVSRAADHLKRAAPAIEGQMGDKQTFVTACEVANLGVSPATALDLMLEHWNPRCAPPWDAEDLEVKIDNAFAYSQNEAGAWATEPAGKVFAGGVLDKLLAESAARPAPKPRFSFQTLEERADLPPPSWLIQDMIPDKAVTMLYGPGGGGKTFIALRLGLDLAKEGKRVGYVMGEGGTGPDQRVKSWRLATDTPGSIPFAIVDEMPLAIDDASMMEFAERAMAFKPDLLIIDTVAWFALGVKENDASEMMRVVKALNTLARDLDCAILAIHHTGKDATRGARGSDALLFGINAALETESDDATGIVTVRARRQKDAEARKMPWAYEIKSLGPSAVAIPISAAERRLKTEADDLVSPQRVARYLREMGAVGEAGAVTSHVLAAHALSRSTDAPTDPEAAQERVSALSRTLGKRARYSLAGFTYGEDDARRWAIPDGEPAV